jgi:hypothetical protein
MSATALPKINTLRPAGATTVNDPAQIQHRLNAGLVPRFWPWIMLPARTLLFALAQLVLFGIYSLLGKPQAWTEAGKAWMVSDAAVNVLVLALLVWLVSKEGIRFRHLTSFDPKRLGKDLLFALAFLIPAVVAGTLGTFGGSLLIYGNPLPPNVFFKLPVLATLIYVIVFPISNAAVELPTYYGYAYPRLEAMTKRPWLSLGLAIFFLGLQHISLNLVFDAHYLAWRFLSMVPVAILVGLVYRRTRRLFPMQVAHWVMDLQLAISALTMGVL